MARIQLLLCFTILFASVTLLDVVSAHLTLKPALPKINDPKTVKDVEPYTVQVVMVFVSDLEKECPKTNKFKAFFDKLRAYAKYVCPLGKSEEKDYDRDMKAKAGSLFQAISSFAVGKLKEELQEEKMEAMNTFKFMKTLAGKILGGREKEESEESMTLTAEQQKEIKEGILKWETVITKITNTMVVSTTNSSSDGESASGSSGSSSFGSGTTFKDTTGSGSYFGSPSGSPKSSPSRSTYGASGGSGASFKDTTGGISVSPSGSPAKSPSSGSPAKSPSSGSPAKSPSSGSPAKSPSSGSPAKSPSSGGSTSSASSKSVSSSQTSATTIAEVETETSEEVMTFIMNLEKKCPQKEEYKSFFEKLKATMTASAKVASEKKKGFFSGIKSAAGKVSDAMTFIGSRLGSKSSEVKKSMEAYHGEVIKALQELDTIHGKIISQNQGKADGSLAVTATQRTEIKQTITKWEQVTTQFVETAIQSETTTHSSAGLDKMKLN